MKEKNAEFSMRINLDQPSSTFVDNWKVLLSSTQYAVLFAIFIITLLLLIIICIIEVKCLNTKAEEKEDYFINFDKENKNFDVKKFSRRRSDEASMDNPDGIEAYNSHSKQMRRNSTIEVSSQSKLRIECDHKMEFVTELELV